MTNTEMQTGATDFQAPQSIVDGVVVGGVLGDNSPRVQPLCAAPYFAH